MEFNIGDILIGVGIGMLIALQLVQIVARAAIKKVERELKEESSAVKIDGKELVEATITKEKDTYYLFQKDNDRFLAQGKTLEEIHDALASRFKNLVVKVDKIPDELKQKTT